MAHVLPLLRSKRTTDLREAGCLRVSSMIVWISSQVPAVELTRGRGERLIDGPPRGGASGSGDSLPTRQPRTARA